MGDFSDVMYNGIADYLDSLKSKWTVAQRPFNFIESLSYPWIFQPQPSSTALQVILN